MKVGKFAVLTSIMLMLSSCVYSPLSRKFVSWSSDLCGRKTFFERLCSGFLMTLMFPVYLGAIILDFPLALIEFFFGFAPFKDPLVKTSSIDFNEHRFPGRGQGEEWIVQRLVELPDSFHVKKTLNGQLIDEYVMTPLENGQLKVRASSHSTAAKLVPREYRMAELPQY